MKHFLVLFLLSYSFFVSSCVSATEDSDEDTETLQIINGQAVISLKPEIQKTAGLKTVKLQEIEYLPEFISFGKAIAIRPLLSLHNQLLSSTSKQTNLKARYTQAEKSMSRLKNLHKNKAVSTRKFQDQKIKWQSEKATYNEILLLTKSIIYNSQLQWGETLTQWLTSPISPEFNALINRKSTLLEITLPANTILNQHDTIQISPTGNRNTASKASFVSILPQVDNFSQSQQCIFLTNNPLIKPGMNITAWITQHESKQTGVIIPQSSLIWHLGQALVFIKKDENHFIHQDIKNPIKVANGYFITSEIKDDEEIVVTGSQMLLSQEFRAQIPDEDDDD